MNNNATVVGYLRVSTHEQSRSGLGMEAQRVAIEQFAKQHQFEISEFFEDVQTGKGHEPLAMRPGLAAALELARKKKCGHHRLVLAESAGLGARQQHGRPVLCRGPGGSDGALRQTRDTWSNGPLQLDRG